MHSERMYGDLEPKYQNWYKLLTFFSSVLLNKVAADWTED